MNIENNKSWMEKHFDRAVPILGSLRMLWPMFFKGIHFGLILLKPITFFSRIKPNSTIDRSAFRASLLQWEYKDRKKVIKHTKWIENGGYCIAIFLRDNGQFLTIAEFNARFGLTVDFLTFSGCICSMKQYVKKPNIAFKR